MGWRVRQGQAVHHDGEQYSPGEAVPCTNAQAAAMPRAVELFQEATKTEAPAAVAETKKRSK